MIKLYHALIVFILLCTPSWAIAATRIALVIGNSNYQQLETLPNTINDASAIAESLQSKGFILVDGQGQNTNSALQDLNDEQIIMAISAFAERAQQAEIAFVYYAGHGMQLAGRPLLLPVNIQKTSLELLQRKAIDLERDVLTPLDGKAQLIVAVFDACRDIPELNNLMQTAKHRGFVMDNYRGLARIEKSGKSRVIAYAGAPGETVSDGTGQTHSPYTQTLLNEMQAGNPEIGNLFRQVSSQFQHQYGGQNPEFSIQGDVPINRFYLSDNATPSNQQTTKTQLEKMWAERENSSNKNPDNYYATHCPEHIGFWQQSAKQDYAIAQVLLGGCYREGQGVAKDAAQAVSWYRKAAEAGNGWGMANLGWMYESGTGVAKDVAQAVSWYRKAADLGEERAINYLKKLKTKH